MNSDAGEVNEMFVEMKEYRRNLVNEGKMLERIKDLEEKQKRRARAKVEFLYKKSKVFKCIQ